MIDGYIVTDAPTVEEYAQEYVDTLNGPANGWGQHICKRTGYVSHVVHRIGMRNYGEKEFNDAIDAVFAKEES